MADPKLWRALSTVALLVAIVLLVVDVQPAAWYVLILSGVLFGVELLLNRSGRAPRHRP